MGIRAPRCFYLYWAWPKRVALFLLGTGQHQLARLGSYPGSEGLRAGGTASHGCGLVSSGCNLLAGAVLRPRLIHWGGKHGWAGCDWSARWNQRLLLRKARIGTSVLVVNLLKHEADC